MFNISTMRIFVSKPVQSKLTVKGQPYAWLVGYIYDDDKVSHSVIVHAFGSKADKLINKGFVTGDSIEVTGWYKTWETVDQTTGEIRENFSLTWNDSKDALRDAKFDAVLVGHVGIKGVDNIHAFLASRQIKELSIPQPAAKPRKRIAPKIEAPAAEIVEGEQV